MIKKVAFYLNNSRISSVDCSNIMDGNPGIGGSEYAMLLLATYLTIYNKEELDVYLYAEKEGLFSPDIKCRVVKELNNIEAHLIKDKIEFLVLRHSVTLCTRNSYLNSINSSIKVIIWAHNFVSRKYLSYYANNKMVEQIVCVGKEQLDLFRDHKAFKKSSYIYNGINLRNADARKDIPLHKRPNDVTYIGSLVPDKGFHEIARVWKEVVKAIPDAKLNVIGSGKLYNRNAQLGKFGIAEKSYEDSFIHYLLDDKGDILKSVIFHGILGAEKNDVLLRTKVGVPNPTGETETFGYTAVEMQAMGCVVVTKKCAGYLDTSLPSGILVNDIRQLKDAIVKKLLEKDTEEQPYIAKLVEQFDISIISANWIRLFNSELSKSKKYRCNHLSFRFKWLRELNRRIKNIIPFGYRFLPSISFYESIIYNIKQRIAR